jgi:hypothetical protein
VLVAARADARLLVIGVDTDASSMREASRKAAGKAALPNALFVAADALDALRLFDQRVDEVRITLPWGQLLRHVLDGEREFALAVAGSL